MKSHAEIGAFSNLEQRVVFPQFKSHDSWLFSNVLIHFIKPSLKPYRFRIEKMIDRVSQTLFLYLVSLKFRLFEANL